MKANIVTLEYLYLCDLFVYLCVSDYVFILQGIDYCGMQSRYTTCLFMLTKTLLYLAEKKFNDANPLLQQVRLFIIPLLQQVRLVINSLLQQVKLFINPLRQQVRLFIIPLRQQVRLYINPLLPCLQ